MLYGQADYFYPDNQSTRLLWYHDHAHGITRVNAYAGIATGYLLLDMSQETTLSGRIPSISSTIPLVFQDKIFVDPATIKGTDPTLGTVARPDIQPCERHSLVRPLLRSVKVEKSGRRQLCYSPQILPAFRSSSATPCSANGLVYPLLTVEPKPYRFFFLNANNARFLNINLLQVERPPRYYTRHGAHSPTYLIPTNPPGPPIIQIGTEGGYLHEEVVYSNNISSALSRLRATCSWVMPRGRIASSTSPDFKDGIEFTMYNDAPGPFPVGDPATHYFLNNITRLGLQPVRGRTQGQI